MPARHDEEHIIQPCNAKYSSNPTRRQKIRRQDLIGIYGWAKGLRGTSCLAAQSNNRGARLVRFAKELNEHTQEPNRPAASACTYMRSNDYYACISWSWKCDSKSTSATHTPGHGRSGHARTAEATKYDNQLARPRYRGSGSRST